MAAAVSRSQLEALRGSPALEDALKQCKFVARQYAYFYRWARGPNYYRNIVSANIHHQ